MSDSRKITMRLDDVRDTLAKKAHDKWGALNRDD